MTSDATRVEVSRRIAARPDEIFAVLSDPRRHIEIDGSDMLRGTLADGPVTGVGDRFSMRMWYVQFGDYVMGNTVVEFEKDRHIAWEPAREDNPRDELWHHRWGYELEPDDGGTVVTEYFDCSRSPDEAKRILKGGTTWLEAMTKTLERLEERFAAEPAEQPSGLRTAVGAITLFCEDLPASRAFYEKAFSPALLVEDANSACYKLSNLVLNLLDAREAPGLIAPEPVAPSEAGSRFQLTIFVDDTDAAASELAGRGVELSNGPIDRPWGMRTACFADPSGHIWELASEIS